MSERSVPRRFRLELPINSPSRRPHATSKRSSHESHGETKELIAGFWLWKVPSLQEALDWVKRCPNPHEEECEIEIRPVFEVEDFGDAATPEIREREARLRAQVEQSNQG